MATLPTINPNPPLPNAPTKLNYGTVNNDPATANAIVPSSPVPSPISVSDLTTPATPITLPEAPATPTPTDYAATLKSLEGLMTPAAPSDAAKASDTLAKSILDTTGKLGTKTTTQARVEDETARALGATGGISDFNVQLRDITNQISSLTKEGLAKPLKTQEEFNGRAAQGFIDTTSNSRIRMNTIKALGLSAIAQTIQGNITTAQETAKRAVELEFAPEEAKLAYLTKAYELNKDVLTREDAKAAKELEIKLAERTRILAEEKKNYQDAQDTLLKIVSANPKIAPATLNSLQAIKDPVQLALKATELGLTTDTTGLPASAQEFLFAKRNGYTGDFNTYQTEDANRKRSIAAAGVANESGLNPKQVTIFNGIVDKYNKSPLIAANDRAVILRDVTSALAADPKNASLQVSFIYSMIQALDTYQSAVREGEIGLISSTQGLGDKIQNLPSQIQNGTPLSVNKVNEYIATAKILTDSIAGAAQKKRDAFTAQSRIAGVGQAFNDFTGAISGTPPQKPDTDPLKLGTGTSASASNPLGI